MRMPIGERIISIISHPAGFIGLAAVSIVLQLTVCAGLLCGALWLGVTFLRCIGVAI